MKKRFNDTGACFPEDHYMVDISSKTAKILRIIEQGDYFVINRPRQYGKTTMLSVLNKLLKPSKDYFPIKLSFEGLGEECFQHAAVFIDAFFLLLKEEFTSYGDDKLVEFIDSEPIPDRMDKLGFWIGKLVQETGKKIVLMIDEIDKSSNNQLFLDFLGMLRNKYLKRHEPGQFTFYSVILAGVHNVKNLRLKMGLDADPKYNSPWNIAVDFNVDMSFNPTEIASMLNQYVAETGIELNIDTTAQSLYYYTSGYPFLVSKLCKIIDEEIIVEGNRKNWNPDDVERAVNRLIYTSNTNFESLTKNLENNKDLFEFVKKITLSDETFEFNLQDPIIDMGVMHGIFKVDASPVEIHNRIYKELIYNYMASVYKREAILKPSSSYYNLEEPYLTGDGKLDFERVLLKFQEFMKKEYSKRDEAFLERNGRLIFLAFVKPILNGKGYDFKEVQASEEKRMDVIITYKREKFIIELKIWRGQKAHENGIAQLSNYLETQGLKNGYLIIFDFTKKEGKVYKKKRIASNQKNIFAVWV
ncbi:MAG TPA: AAA family ATPase [Candidatus Kapabacteria bacterium]|nr:AAA family ATPase [Candidatus Kapabacteria bacterium]